jgi:hypothetical protein
VSKVPPLNLKAEDYGKIVADYPEMDGLIRNLNRFGGGVGGALGKGLTLGENSAVQIADITVEPKDDWRLATYQNAWVTYAPDAAFPAQYVKLEHGTVWMRGRITGGATGTVAFTLPADYAPDRAVYLTAMTSGIASAQVTVATSGTVTVAYLLAPAWIAIDAVRFLAADRHPELNPAFPMKVALKLPQGRKVIGCTALNSRDTTTREPTHSGNPLWVDWHETGGQLVIENISGLAPSRKYAVKLLIWGG